MRGSHSGTFDRDDLIKIAKGAGIAVAGALLAYVSSEVIPLLEDADAPWLLALSAAASVLVNAARKWLADYSGRIR